MIRSAAADRTARTTDDRTGWRHALWKGGIAYVVSRVCVLAGAAVVAAKGLIDLQQAGGSATKPELRATGLQMMEDVLTSWDGVWYLRIIRSGYPIHIPPGVTVDQPEARAAFFPLFPAAVRLADRLLPGGDVAAALVLNFVLGALVILLSGLLARRLLGADRAGRAMVLMAVFPGSLALSLIYSEALFLCFAAACLVCLHDRRWLAAGVLAALATATRPNGLALVAACAVAAALAIRERRDWKALMAPALSPLGFLAFQLWLDRRVDEQGVWFRVQREAWNESSSWGLAAMRRTVSAFAHPLLSKTDFMTALTLIATILLLYLAWRQRLPWAMLAYSAAVLLLMLLPSNVTARPRFLYTAFPLLISLAGWWWYPRAADGAEDGLFWGERGDWWALLISISCAGIVTLTGLYGSYGAMP